VKKRTYRTGSYRELPSGKWLLEYRPKWAAKRQSKAVEIAGETPAQKEKAVQKVLSDWVTELDARASQMSRSQSMI
jgi:hypothetical protein